MTKLICTLEFLNDLIKESIIEPQGNGEFRLYTKANLKGHSYPINITCDHNVTETEVEELTDNSIFTLDQWYNLIKEEFPTNAGKHLSIDGRNLRSGTKSKVKKNIQKLIDESYNLTAVIQAIKYEVWFRIKDSRVGDNKLEFMKGMEPWLNDTSNIDAMIDRSNESNEFKLATNMDQNDTSGTKRKIKLS